MSSFLTPWKCRLLIRHAHGGIKHAAGAVHHARHVRRIRRAAAIVCVSVGSFGSAALIPPLFYAPAAMPPAINAGSGFPSTSSASRPQPIPEPSSLALLLLAAVVAIAIAGRRV